MQLLGIGNSPINWVIDFLMQRRQRVKLGSVLSDWEFVNGGVPQGTILGPLLFAAAGSTPNFDMLHSTQSFAPIYVIEISISRLSIFKMS